MDHYARSALIVLGILILQATFVPFLSIGGFLPDLFLIWVVYSAIRRGQMEATIAGFVVGLLQDLVTTQFFGLAALSKTVCGFTAGYFFNENNTERTLGSYRFVLITALSSMVHNVLFFSLFLQGLSDSLLSDVLRSSTGTAFYTAMLSLLPMFAFSRKYRLAS